MSCKKIEITDLTVDLHGPQPRRLVDGLTLTIPGGGSVALVGESGAGKSMTALAILGLLPTTIRQTAGDIAINHISMSDRRCDAGRRVRGGDVALIMQNPMSAFDPVFTIASHFRQTLAAHGLPSQGAAATGRAEAALAEAGFDAPKDILGLYPFQMSGGMLQRVMIALALVLDPDFLIADEATTDLDTVSQSRILRLLDARRRQRHLGLLLITHDLGVAALMADTIAVMHRGRLVEQGPTAAVFANPKHPYTARLLAAHRTLYGPKFRSLLDRLGVGAGGGEAICA